MISGAVATQRLFFALWPEPAVQKQLYAQAQPALHGCRGRPVARDHLHLTLVFLGSVTREVRQCLEAAADGLHLPAFTLVFDRIGYWRRPRVLWLGGGMTPEPLRALVDGLNRGVVSCGRVAESRPYQAHVTVARKVSRDPGPLMLAPLDWRVTRFALVESRTDPAGAVYRPLRYWELGVAPDTRSVSGA
jgi:2'-5' RNA ligase